VLYKILFIILLDLLSKFFGVKSHSKRMKIHSFRVRFIPKNLFQRIGFIFALLSRFVFQSIRIAIIFHGVLLQIELNSVAFSLFERSLIVRQELVEAFLFFSLLLFLLLFFIYLFV